MTGRDLDQARVTWWVIGAALAIASLFAIYSFIGTFVFAVFIYYATRPIYRRVRKRFRRSSVCAALSLSMLTLPALLLFIYTLGIALDELSNLQSKANLGPYASILSRYTNLSSLANQPQQLFDNAGGFDVVQETLNSLLSSLGFVGTGLLHLFVMFAVAFYLLRDAGKLSRLLARFGDDRGVYDAYARAVDKSLETVFFGNILNAIMTGAIGAISYSLLDLSLVAPAGMSIPYPALTGLLAGIASLIPVVGMKIVYVPVAVYLTGTAYFQGSGYWYVATFVAVSFVLVDSVPDLFLRPYVTGKNLHVGSVMIAYILGPLLFGWYGLFLGPIVLVLVVHFVRIVLPVLLEKEALRPVPVDPRYMTGADPGATAERAVRDPDPEVAADGAPEEAGDETGA